MRATGIRYNEKYGSGRPTERILHDLCECIIHKMSLKGFITDAHVLNGFSIKIGLHMSSFRVNTEMLGHNARVGRYVDSPKGYKRTNVPTWNQRVEFNNIVNNVFNSYGLVANIKSGPFTVRDKIKGAHDESDWEDQTPSYSGYHGDKMNGMGEVISEIIPESEARERCDSDHLESEHKEKMKPLRAQQARERREVLKLFNSQKSVLFKLSKYRNEVKMMSMRKFVSLLKKMSKYEARQAKSASIEATIELVRQGIYR